jgi:hypothetical protein
LVKTPGFAFVALVIALRRFEHGAVVRVEANVEIAELKLVGLLRVVDERQQHRLLRAEFRLEHVLEAGAARRRAVRQDLEVARALEPVWNLLRSTRPKSSGVISPPPKLRDRVLIAHQ